MIHSRVLSPFVKTLTYLHPKLAPYTYWDYCQISNKSSHFGRFRLIWDGSFFFRMVAPHLQTEVITKCMILAYITNPTRFAIICLQGQ